jgi:hypothetical protein
LGLVEQLAGVDAVGLELVDHRVVKLDEGQVQLRHNQVFVVAGVA